MRVQPIPGKPGHFVDENGEVIVFTEARETDRYDTVEQVAGAISAGATLTFFNDKTNKNEFDTNMPVAGKLVTGSERLILESIGVSPQAMNAVSILGSADLKRVLCSGYLEVKLNRNVIEEGPVEKFPCGYGPYGSTVENNTGIFTNGVPSRAAVRPLKEQQIITDNHTIKATIVFQSRTWLTVSTMPTLDGVVAIRLYMHGILEAAATNN